MKNEVSEEARRLLEVVPPLMRTIRTEMRRASAGKLTVPQFRVLARLRREPASNQELAEWMGVSPPTMSKMVAALVQKGLVTKKEGVADRRSVLLTCSKKGLRLSLELRQVVQEEFTRRLSRLSRESLRELEKGLQVMRELIR